MISSPTPSKRAPVTPTLAAPLAVTARLLPLRSVVSPRKVTSTCDCGTWSQPVSCAGRYSSLLVKRQCTSGIEKAYEDTIRLAMRPTKWRSPFKSDRVPRKIFSTRLNGCSALFKLPGWEYATLVVVIAVEK